MQVLFCYESLELSGFFSSMQKNDCGSCVLLYMILHRKPTIADHIMKKTILTAALAALLLSSLTSCMGKFALTRNLYAWNDQVSNKFVNEIIFVAFWILPVYEVCGIADLLVLNTIEFWRGDNPITASTKAIDTAHGRYLVVCDG